MKLELRLTLASLAALAFVGCGAASTTTDPAKVQIVTSDLPNFWRAYDDAAHLNDRDARTLVYEREYFAPGSAGLRGFIPERLASPGHLEKVVTIYRRYYAATRPEMARISSKVPLLRADLERFKAFYPDVVFPNIYFVVGALNSGGTSKGDIGLIIGAEMVSRPESPAASAAPLTQPVDAIPSIVSHELVHFNQRVADTAVLLDSTLVEGSADFLGELADGHEASEATWKFGCANEARLWSLFSQQQQSNDKNVIDAWLFSDRAPLKAPPFIGYWVGYRIVQTYYLNAPDKRAAISNILHIKDYPAFLDASGYPAKKPLCRRIPRWQSG